MLALLKDPEVKEFVSLAVTYSLFRPIDSPEGKDPTWSNEPYRVLLETVGDAKALEGLYEYAETLGSDAQYGGDPVSREEVLSKVMSHPNTPVAIRTKAFDQHGISDYFAALAWQAFSPSIKRYCRTYLEKEPCKRDHEEQWMAKLDQRMQEYLKKQK